MVHLKKNSIDQSLYRINKHIKTKSFSDAKKICLNLLRQYPNNSRIKKILETLPTNNDGESLEKEFNSLTSAFNSNKYDLVIENGVSLLKKNENDTNINNLVAAAYLEKKQYNLAIQYCDKAITSNPNNYFAFNNKGVAYSNLKKYSEAIQEFKKAINIKKNVVESYLGISNNYFIINKNNQAIEILEKAPDEIYKNTQIQRELGKHYSKIKNFQKAKYFLHEVIKKEPYDGVSLFNLHTFYFETCDYKSSCKYLVEAYKSDKNNLKFNRALAEIYLLNYYCGRTLDPDKINISYDFGSLNKNFTPTDLDKCKFHLDKIYNMDASDLDNNYTYIMYLFLNRETDKSIKHLKKYIENLDHSNIGELSSKISAYLFLLSHTESYGSKYNFNEHKKYGFIFENQLRNFKGKYKHKLEIEKTIRVGFVSKDFKEHPAKSSILALWKNLEKFNVEIHAFNNEPLASYNESGDFKKNIHAWYDIYNLDDTQLAEYIFQKEIDILIDLSGHTDGNRLLTFAYKPSPLQITCIGYVGTTGLKNMDYVLCDERSAPKYIYDNLYVENMLRIPSLAAWSPHPKSPEIKKLPALKNNYITFGSFNYPRKITKRSIKLWSKILLNNPNSMLVQAAVDSHAIKEGLLKDFEENGVKQDQIKFIPRLKILEFLNYLNDNIDICLDNTMYTGGTTTLHTLWMGVPIVTLRGENAVQNASASCMENSGINEFIAKTEEEYASIADIYSKDLKKLNHIRLTLRERCENSKWRDPDLISDGFGTALRKIWENYCNGEPTKSLEIKLDEIQKI